MLLKEILLCSLFLTVSPDTFDPTKFDYCKVECSEKTKNVTHSACDCYMEGEREEMMEDIVKFRQEVLQKHNELRNYVASGMETNPKTGKATNMRALNYDLELEYIARCYAARFTTLPDVCISSQKYNFTGQNYVGHSEKKPEMVQELIKQWYDEITNIGDTTIESFPTQDAAANFSSFTQLIWATNEYVGCARVWYPGNPDEKYRMVLICNYASSSAASNAPGQTVYIKGEEACSQCPEGMKCHDTYTALCGDIKPVPTDELVKIPSPPKKEESTTEKSSSTMIRGDVLLWVIAVVIALDWIRLKMDVFFLILHFLETETMKPETDTDENWRGLTGK